MLPPFGAEGRRALSLIPDYHFAWFTRIRWWKRFRRGYESYARSVGPDHDYLGPLGDFGYRDDACQGCTRTEGSGRRPRRELTPILPDTVDLVKTHSLK